MIQFGSHLLSLENAGDREKISLMQEDGYFSIIANSENIGAAMIYYADKARVIKLGFNEMTKAFMAIVANKETSPFTVTAKLKDGYKEISAIKPIIGFATTFVTGDIVEFTQNKHFLTGIQGMIAHGFVGTGCLFRNNEIDADDLTVIQIANEIDYRIISIDEIDSTTATITTNREAVRLITTRHGRIFMIGHDGVFISTEQVAAKTIQEIFTTKGVISAKRFGKITFDSRPVTIFDTLTGFVVGLDDGNNVAFAIDRVTGEITKTASAKTKAGALISMNLATATIIVDDGKIMRAADIGDLNAHFRSVAGLTTIAADKATN